jgi:hypothetical protein
LRESRLDRTKLDVLKGYAHAFDVDPEGDYLRPGNSPPERAFQVLSCSLDFLIYLGDVAFPALDKRTRKRGAKWLRQALLFFGGNASVLLANAVPLLMVETGGRLSPADPADPVVSPEQHLRLHKAVQSFFPIGRKDEGFMDRCLAEFRVMEAHEPRERVREGEQEPNEYSAALLRGENPDDDPELVAMQREYARDWFIDRATFGAVSRGLDGKDRKILSGKLVRFSQLTDESASRELRTRALAAWVTGLGPYHDYARLDSQSP